MYLEVDRKGGHLLRKTEEVDGRVQKTGFELGVQINRATARTMMQRMSKERTCASTKNHELFKQVGQVSDVN